MIGRIALHLGDILTRIHVLQRNLDGIGRLGVDAPRLLTFKIGDLNGIGQWLEPLHMMQSKKHRHLGAIRGPVTEWCISWSQNVQQRLVIGVDDDVEVGYDTVLQNNYRLQITNYRRFT